MVQCYKNPDTMRWHHVHVDYIASILKAAYHLHPQSEVIIQQSLLSVTVQVQRSAESAWHEKNHKRIPTLACSVLHLQDILDSHLTLNMVAAGTFHTDTVSSPENRICFFNNPSKFIPCLNNRTVQHQATNAVQWKYSSTDR